MLYLALKNLRLRKARTVISILAVAVGIMTLLVLRGLTEGTIGEVAERMKSIRADLLVWDKSHNTFMHNHTMRAGYRERIVPMSGVAGVVPVLNDSISLADQAQTIYAVPAKDFEMFGKVDSLVAGRLFESDSMELIIDTILARESGMAVGDTVEHRDDTYTIVGIIREGVVGRVFMSYETAVRLMHHGDRRANMLLVKATSSEAVDEVTRQIKALGLIVVDKGNYYNVIARDAKYLKAFVWSTTAITLFVSFLTILLTMFTIIQEQTREVGILKSLGATNGYVMRLVFYQSLFICSAGVIGGFVLSFGGKTAIGFVYPLLTVTFDWKLLLTAMVVGLAGGLLGACYPAWRAASLDPVETLTYE